MQVENVQFSLDNSQAMKMWARVVVQIHTSWPGRYMEVSGQFHVAATLNQG
jgi:hypothetical protein